jgi:hypothetical protein
MHTINHCICCGESNLLSHPAILSPFVAERTMGWSSCIVNAESELREVPLGVHYPVCKTMKCPSCGTIFSDIRFSDEELYKLYYKYRSSSYTTLRCKYEAEYEQKAEDILNSTTDEYLSRIESFISSFFQNTIGLRVLDWGGDKGESTPFKKNNLCTHIYDINGNEPLFHCFNVNKDQIKQYSYDLIVCSNLLEHVSDPYKLLWEITSVMHSKTFLYIEVPYEEIPFEKKNFWHEHINLFSEAGILTLLSRCNLNLEEFTLENALWEGKQKRFMRIVCKRNAV